MATAIGLAHQVDWDVPEQTGLWKDAWVRFRRNRLAVAGLVVIVVMIVLALGARLPATPGGLWKILHLTNEPFLQDVTNSYATPSLQHPLGTDIPGRGQVLSIKEKEYFEAAIMTGTSPLKLIVKHLVPNSLGPVIVTLTFGIPAAIFTEAALSFLGIGIRPPEPSWGVMIEDGYAGIFADPRQVIFPGIAVALTMLSFTFVGDGLRDALDPRMRR